MEKKKKGILEKRFSKNFFKKGGELAPPFKYSRKRQSPRGFWGI